MGMVDEYDIFFRRLFWLVISFNIIFFRDILRLENQLIFIEKLFFI